MSAMAVCWLVSGLQDGVDVAKHKCVTRLVSSTLSGPSCQVRGLFFTLPPIVLARVAASLCPGALRVHVALVWPGRTWYPCVQQYPLGLGSGLVRFPGLWAVGALGVVAPLVRRVYAVVRAATLAVRAATLAEREALFSMSWASVVFSVVAAAARLSRYPSSRSKVSGVMGMSLVVAAMWAEPWYGDWVAASCCRFRARCAAR